ncbi:UDP-glucose/GDP-mannose dehydrogenase family protein [Schnuerera sp. xch1]|uniref:UDP-glucose dehydrogenase family protein n=1 Tax=Schnuerera sp. xch1 TaxID=2874283 RepID=UPI001CBEFBCE|nr:UDP-glucose/GDP-mannose dehydrogenase family protein [Schnuerera sp. xch1]MBZ2174084.1 UDP-glucose/GDP-mannose dehydrogenase family protein [Schnuerera sp. xch1]
MYNIAIIGTGYVGLVTGTSLADFGMNVTCVDNNAEKIDMLNSGKIPIYEPALDDLVERNVYYKRLTFTTNIKKAVEESEVIFIAVGTPPQEDGSADLHYVMDVAKDIATYMNGYKVIVDKSTVPVGTGQKVKKTVQNILVGRGVDYEFDVVSNPEFLREGSAIYDFTHPDRIVLGVESEKAEDIMKDVYRVLNLNEVPFVVTNIETAEMIKYASNAFLAMKISYINELANLCEKVGADVHHVAKAMGMDGRISPKFLHPGPGYGGSCFPKDTEALVKIGQQFKSPVTLIEQTIKTNENQKQLMVEKVREAMGELKDKTLGILGITFKPNTDDMREAPSLIILNELVKDGAKLQIYDPQGQKEGQWRFKDISNHMTFCEDEYEAIGNTDALIILTEWNQFRNLNLDRIKDSMNGNYFFDLRNIYQREMIEKKGFKYYCVGR